MSVRENEKGGSGLSAAAVARAPTQDQTSAKTS